MKSAMLRWCLLAVAGTLLVALLAGCAVTTSDLEGLTPREKVYVLKKDYASKLDVVLDYARQPECNSQRVVACSDKVIVRALHRAAVTADIALDIALTSMNTADIEMARAAYRALVNELVRLQLIEVTK